MTGFKTCALPSCGVVRLARQAGKPVVVMAGSVGEDADATLGAIEGYMAVTEGPVSEAQAMAEPARHLGDLAARFARSWDAMADTL